MISTNVPTQQEINDLDTELLFGCVQGTLTEQRYDEIIAILLPITTIPDARAGLILCSKPEWRKRHGKTSSKTPHQAA
jgi:hypothetical protein